MIKFLIPAFLSLNAKACNCKAEFLHIPPCSDFGVVLPNVVVRPVGYSVRTPPVCAVAPPQIITPLAGSVVNTGAVGVVATNSCGAVGVVATGGCAGTGTIILCQTESECCE